MNIIGTSHFVSLLDAVIYFKPQEGTFDAAKKVVKDKLKDKSITLFEPDLKPGQTLMVKDGRYHICEA